jgi:hypothetical protein
MRDVIFIAIAVVFFAICIAYIGLCDRIIGPDPVDQNGAEPLEGVTT